MTDQRSKNNRKVIENDPKIDKNCDLWKFLPEVVEIAEVEEVVAYWPIGFVLQQLLDLQIDDSLMMEHDYFEQQQLSVLVLPCLHLLELLWLFIGSILLSKMCFFFGSKIANFWTKIQYFGKQIPIFQWKLRKIAILSFDENIECSCFKSKLIWTPQKFPKFPKTGIFGSVHIFGMSLSGILGSKDAIFDQKLR